MRARWHLPLVLLLAAACGEGADPVANHATVQDPAQRLRNDDRLAGLLAPCGPTNIYDVVTGDMLPRLIDKLEHGQLDPLKHAKEELGSLGDVAVPDLQRLVERNYANAFSAAYVENALDAICLSKSAAARPIVLHCLGHPQESVRLRAAQAMRAGHVLPEDFDMLLGRLESGETDLVKKTLSEVLFVADPARAEEVYLGWVRDGKYPQYIPQVVDTLTPSPNPTTRAACGTLFANLQPPWGAALAAPAAVSGNEEALAYLRGLKDDPNQPTRLAAAHAMLRAGLHEILADWLQTDRDEIVRSKGAEALAQLEEWTPRQLDIMTAAMEDISPRVSAYALKVLVARGNADAIDRAMRFLRDAESSVLQSALLALREPMATDPALANRAWGILHERSEAEAHMPLLMRAASFKSIGTVPLAEAAEYLHRVGVEHEGEAIEGLAAHRWLMIHAGNTGLPGRRRLAELLDEETDPLRRLDLVGAIGSTREEFSRTALQRISEEASTSPYEVLYVASLLVKIGPAAQVAERLQRVYFRMEAGEVYDALECLLWKWF